MSDKTTRQWNIMALIPAWPRRIDAKTIRHNLAEYQFRVSIRTIERDLVELSATFPLVADERSLPFGWSWEKGAVKNAHSMPENVKAIGLVSANGRLKSRKKGKG
jgi:predicted DNA-binding transcriptional regulator YafY